jgi:hypothetical protein
MHCIPRSSRTTLSSNKEVFVVVNKQKERERKEKEREKKKFAAEIMKVSVKSACSISFPYSIHSFVNINALSSRGTF